MIGIRFMGKLGTTIMLCKTLGGIALETLRKQKYFSSQEFHSGPNVFYLQYPGNTYLNLSEPAGVQLCARLP